MLLKCSVSSMIYSGFQEFGVTANIKLSISTKYSYDLCRHICKSYFKFVYLMSAKIVKRLILRDMFPLCLKRNVSNKLFPDR